MSNIINQRIVIALSAVAIFTLSLVSCKKDSNDPTPAPAASMSAKINSIDETDSTIITATKDWSSFTRVTFTKSNIFNIIGTELSVLTTPDMINITINGTTEGTYKLGIQNMAAQCGCVLSTKYNDANVMFTSTSGTVVITKVDTTNKLVSGTFEFWLFSGGVWKTITNGKFENLKYEER